MITRGNMKALQERLMGIINEIDNLPYDIPKDVESELDKAYQALNEAHAKLNS